MAVVQGVRERVHFPVYDCISVQGGKQLRETESSSTLRFFVNVQGKTKLETNLQSSSLLPHYNTFEARALRVVMSDLSPDFGEEKVKVKTTGQPPVDEVEVTLSDLIDSIREAREGGKPDVPITTTSGVVVNALPAALETALDSLDRKVPINAQIDDEDTAAAIINRFIYNTVTTFYVGEKTMIQMPTWFFLAGAGTYSESGSGATHGLPSPSDTFRFAEPIQIEKQQNFRVEIEIPDSDVLKDLQRIYGPMFIWVVLDGYMTRSVQ